MRLCALATSNLIVFYVQIACLRSQLLCRQHKPTNSFNLETNSLYFFSICTFRSVNAITFRLSVCNCISSNLHRSIDSSIRFCSSEQYRPSLSRCLGSLKSFFSIVLSIKVELAGFKPAYYACGILRSLYFRTTSVYCATTLFIII